MPTAKKNATKKPAAKKTTTAKAKATKSIKKPIKKCSNKKCCDCGPETHSLKNLIILWICLFAAAILGILAYAYMINGLAN